MLNSSRGRHRGVRYAAATVALGLAAGMAAFPAHSDDINEQVAEASDDLARADAKVDAAVRKNRKPNKFSAAGPNSAG